MLPCHSEGVLCPHLTPSDRLCPLEEVSGQLKPAEEDDDLWARCGTVGIVGQHDNARFRVHARATNGAEENLPEVVDEVPLPELLLPASAAALLEHRLARSRVSNKALSDPKNDCYVQGSPTQPQALSQAVHGPAEDLAHFKAPQQFRHPGPDYRMREFQESCRTCLHDDKVLKVETEPRMEVTNRPDSLDPLSASTEPRLRSLSCQNCSNHRLGQRHE